MTQDNTLNIKLSHKLNSGIKNSTEVILNVVGGSNYKTNFQHKLLLINKQVSRICQAFANVSAVNINFSKTQWSKMAQVGTFAIQASKINGNNSR